MHSGCFELFAHEPIRTISDLKGKRVGIQSLGSSGHLSSRSWRRMSGSTRSGHRLGRDADGNPMELFAAGKIDAFLGFPPEPQELRARNIGRVILSTTIDRPWSQYFCCIVFGNRDFVRDYPVATKRYLRAVLKAADFCATEPERRATAGRCRVHATLRLCAPDAERAPYDRWREFDPEDSMRFYALRLHEAGMIKSSPNALIAEGTDWRFLNELKRELKA